MYIINTQIQEGQTAHYPEDFPMLKNNSTFAMLKQDNDFIIQTIESDNKIIKKLIEAGEAELNTRIEGGHNTADKLNDPKNYLFTINRSGKTAINLLTNKTIKI